MNLRMGDSDFALGEDLGELRDANALLGNPEALRARLEADGYLLIRGLLPREDVLRARKVVLQALAAEGLLDPGAPVEEARTGARAAGVFWGGRKPLTHHPDVLAVLESPVLARFFADLLGGEVRTYDYKWLRAVGHGEFTGAHYDIVYMGRGTPCLHTCWTPLSDIDHESSPLAVLVGSHRFDRVRETYGQMDVDRDRVDGWFTNNPLELAEQYGGEWKTANFSMGDVMIFGMFTMHGALNNRSGSFRLSCDTRFQLASEPVDERWIGENPIGHYAWQTEPDKVVPMADARAKSGV